MSGPSSTVMTSDADRIDRLRRQLAYAELKIQALEEELRLDRIKKYGPKSDTVPSAQLKLLEAEPGVSEVEVEHEVQREPIAAIEQSVRGGASSIPEGRRCRRSCRAWSG